MAAIWSGGRSSFRPVAVGFGVAITLEVAHRTRRHPTAAAVGPEVVDPGSGTIPTRSPSRRSVILAVLAGAVFIVAVAAFYGTLMTPSPRDGVRPVEGNDVAFYAVLGADLAATGIETNTGPSGFSNLAGARAQDWYHRGELWLASAVITIVEAAPLAARYFVVLPVLLLAAAALTGTLVRRLNRGIPRGLPVRVPRRPVPGADPAGDGPFFSNLRRKPRVRGTGPWADYLTVLRAGAGAGAVDPRNMGPVSLLGHVVPIDAGEIQVAQAVVTLVALAAALLAAARVRDPLMTLAVAIAASLLVLPVTWYRYPVALIPIGIALLMRRPAVRARVAVTVAVVVADVAIGFPPMLWVVVTLLLATARRRAPVHAPANHGSWP